MTEIDMKPLQRLRGEELKEINEAIVEGYDLANWSRALRYNWGIVLGNYVDTHQGFNGVVADLIAWTEQKGKTRELLALAFAQNPENEGLIKVAAKYGITRALLNESSEEPSTRRKPQSLEAMVSSHSRLVNYARFLARLQGVGERVCLVKTPAKKGTGFLVAPDCVLTNFHVVEDVIRNMALIDRVICQFNFQENEDLSEQAASKSFRLNATAFVAQSRYSESDLTGSGEPDPSDLDYAILHLVEQIGSLPGRSNNPRGWFELETDGPVVTLRDFVVIPQHAEGHPLEIAWGSVVAFPASGHRVRYDTTTSPHYSAH